MIERRLFKAAAALTIPLLVACGSGESKGITIEDAKPTSSGIGIRISPYGDTSENVRNSFKKETERESARWDPLVNTVSYPKLNICFSWPVEGSVATYFTKSHPLGIDIDTYELGKNALVHAPADGKVVFAGGNPEVSYGNYVLIDHGQGIKTLHGHLSKIDINKDQTVNRGDIIGNTGKTGYALGDHLHFEVWVTDRRQNRRFNPMDYLDTDISDAVCTTR